MSEYSIPVLVKWFDKRPGHWASNGCMDKYMGTVVLCKKHDDDTFISLRDKEDILYNDPVWYWELKHVIPYPTKSQIKEEAAKTGKKPVFFGKAPKAPKPTLLEKALAAAEEKIQKAVEHKRAIQRIIDIDKEMKDKDAAKAKLKEEREELAKKHLRGMK